MKVSTFDLRVFAAIVDLGGISAAARQLNREKSTVSRDLSGLEERLGVRLLQRTTRSISLTEAGEIFAAYARRVVEELDNVENAIEALNDEPRGLLRVTAPFAIIRFVLAPRLQAFLNRYPQLRMSLDPTTRIVDLVEEGVDIAIRIGEMPASSLIVRKLQDARLILVAGKSYLKAHGVPAAPRDLAHHHLIDLSAGPATGEWQLMGRKGESARVNVAPRTAITDPGIAFDFAKEGMGIATLPDLYAGPGIREGSLVRVLPAYDRGTRPVQAVYPSRRQLTPKLRVFVEFVAESLKLAAKAAQ